MKRTWDLMAQLPDHADSFGIAGVNPWS